VRSPAAVLARCRLPVLGGLALAVASSVALAQGAGAGVQALGPEEAVVLALEHNLTLKGARLGPEIAATELSAAATSWTPQLSTRIAAANRQTPPASAFDPSRPLTNQNLQTGLLFGQQLPWGSSYSVGWDGTRLASNNVLARFQPQLGAAATATFVQPLLKDLRFDAARAAQATAVETMGVADAEWRTAVAATRRRVLHAYWTWVYLRDLLSVQRESRSMAQRLLEGNRARVAIGALAAVDVIEAEAEVARRAEVILLTAVRVKDAEDRLRVLISGTTGWQAAGDLEPTVTLMSTAAGASPEWSAASLQRREDLNALRRQLAIDRVDVRKAQNDRLPSAALRVDYAVQATAGTELVRGQGVTGPVTGSIQRGYLSAFEDLAQFRYPSWSVDLSVNYPIGPARADAELARATLKRRQDEAALASAEQEAGVEIRSVARAVEANRERLALTASGVALSERRLDGEERKFAVGLSTSFFVFQAQRDLSAARETRLKSLIEYQLSLADLDAVQTIPLR
jgi:outer membrane protein